MITITITICITIVLIVAIISYKDYKLNNNDGYKEICSELDRLNIELKSYDKLLSHLVDSVAKIYHKINDSDRPKGQV